MLKVIRENEAERAVYERIRRLFSCLCFGGKLANLANFTNVKMISDQNF